MSAGEVTLLRKAARSKGARYIDGEVVSIAREGGRITGVTLSNRERIACGTLVNAAGPQAGDVAALAGIALPVEPRKRSVFVVACRTPLPGMPPSGAGIGWGAKIEGGFGTIPSPCMFGPRLLLGGSSG